MKTFSIVLLGLAVSSFNAFASQAPDPNPPKAPGESLATQRGPQTARVFFKNLKNGQMIPKKYKIQFGADGIAVKPAGTVISGTGHHHLVIDGDAIPPGQVVPADATHLHYGKGQTEAEITLTPGKHKILLQFADGAHFSYGPELSAVVDVIVQ